MKKIVYKSASRGHNNLGWLDSKHTFSFADYYNPERMNFGALRVVNDDIVEGGKGFGKHPHDNMEIVSIPLAGRLEHQDSMGHKGQIAKNEIQIMSAGTGVFHSEYNANAEEDVNFLQIWILPNVQNAKPRYDQKVFDFEANKNSLLLVVSPEKGSDNLWLNQDAWFSFGIIDEGHTLTYKLHNSTHGVFVMNIEGEFDVDGEIIERRDAVGVYESDAIEIKSLAPNAKILVIEIPMNR